MLIVESMAQLAAVVLAAGWMSQAPAAAGPAGSAGSAGPAGLPGGSAARVGYLGAIRQMKFSRLVVPGDQLTLAVELGRGFDGLTAVHVRASVGTEVAAKGTLIVSERGGPGGDGPQ